MRFLTFFAPHPWLRNGLVLLAVAAMPINIDPFASSACLLDRPTYDAYTLTWYRAGLPVEQASANRTSCAFWQDDGVFFHRPYGAAALYADIYAAVNASG